MYEKDVKLGKDGLYEPKVSPVYSLVTQSEALWLLAGLEVSVYKSAVRAVLFPHFC